MRVRSLVAFLMITALAAMCGSDLLFARGRGCGPHPCCVKGACKMMPKGGARLDRCGDGDQTSAPQPPSMLLTSINIFGAALVSSPSATALPTVTADGASLGVDRPPRG